MCRVLMFGLALTTCLVASTPSMAQEAKKKNYAYEHLKPLEWMVGKWTAEGFHDESHIRIVATTKWLHDNKFLRSNWVFMDDGGVVHNREITWYWDPVQKVVRNQEFDSDGEWVRATVEVDDAVIRVRRDIVDEVGKAYSEVTVYKRTGSDSFSFGDEDSQSLKFRRKK